MLNLGILISGRGSNMRALVNACNDELCPARVVCVVSDNENAPGLQFAKELNIPTFTVTRKPLDIIKIHQLLLDYDVGLICLAGFMNIIPAEFLSVWHHKVINIHPSILPSFKGLNAQQQALNAGVKVTGCTVHYVYPEVDSGPIIMQAAVPVLPHDDIMSLSIRILQMEHKIFPESVKLIASGQLIIENHKINSECILAKFYEV